MMTPRSIYSPLTFGRRMVPAEAAVADSKGGLSDDFRLFLMTFAGGFLFMTVYLA